MTGNLTVGRQTEKDKAGGLRDVNDMAKRSKKVIKSALTTPTGAMIAYFYLTAVPYILAFSAASFIYIAVADLIPKLHRKAGLGASIGQTFLLLAGIGTILFFRLHHE